VPGLTKAALYVKLHSIQFVKEAGNLATGQIKSEKKIQFGYIYIYIFISAGRISSFQHCPGIA